MEQKERETHVAHMQDNYEFSSYERGKISNKNWKLSFYSHPGVCVCKNVSSVLYDDSIISHLIVDVDKCRSGFIWYGGF